MSAKRLTIKCLKEFGHENGFNSNQQARAAIKDTGCDADMGRRLFSFGMEAAKSNGRKTVMEKDIAGYVQLYRELRGVDSVKEESVPRDEESKREEPRREEEPATTTKRKGGRRKK